MLQLYPIFAKSGVHLLSGFFGSAKRALRDAGHDVAFLPGDFRRFKLFAERMACVFSKFIRGVWPVHRE